MPAEWESHEATWMSWPHEEGISFPGSYDKVIPVFIQMVEVLSKSEKVYINIRDYAEEKVVSKILPPAVLPQVRFFPFRTNEPWCRDHGPIFIVNRGERRLAVTDWEYNAWGAKYEPYTQDNQVPSLIADALGLERFGVSMILEGGSIEVNGTGSLLTTESCLLNENRNRGWSRLEIEGTLKDYLGVTHVLWLGDGIEGDDTDGHIDDLARFVNRTTVVTLVESDRRDANYIPLQDNLKRLSSMTAEDGTPLKVIALPTPLKMVREELRLPASYANYYLANKSVLLPVFRDPSDDEAISILKTAFPTREVVPIDCRELIWGLGAFHCLTQQVPSV
jgi:agmatine deiminase